MLCCPSPRCRHAAEQLLGSVLCLMQQEPGSAGRQLVSALHLLALIGALPTVPPDWDACRASRTPPSQRVAPPWRIRKRSCSSWRTSLNSWPLSWTRCASLRAPVAGQSPSTLSLVAPPWHAVWPRPTQHWCRCMQGVLVSTRASLSSPASQGALSAFRQRLTPLMLRASSAGSASSSVETTPLSTGRQRAGPGHASPPMAATPASLGRMLRQAASGPGGRGLAGEQLSRSLACYQEQQQQQQQQQQQLAPAKAGAAAPSADQPFPRNDSSMQQAAEQHTAAAPAAAERAPSAAVQH